MSAIEELKKECKSDWQYQMALYSYVYNGQYKEDLKYLKETIQKGEDNAS